MAHTNQPPSDKLLLEAVELRIAGHKWEVVAEKMHRAMSTINKWPMRYPERWQAAIEQAEQRLAVDSNAESVVVLRKMLRDEDTKTRLHAAKTLVGMRLELGKLAFRIAARGPAPAAQIGKPLDKWAALGRLADQFTDAELEEFRVRFYPDEPMPAALGTRVPSAVEAEPVVAG